MNKSKSRDFISVGDPYVPDDPTDVDAAVFSNLCESNVSTNREQWKNDSSRALGSLNPLHSLLLVRLARVIARLNKIDSRANAGQTGVNPIITHARGHLVCGQRKSRRNME